MKYPLFHWALVGLVVAGASICLNSLAAFADQPAVAGYADYDAYRLEVESIAASRFATSRSLGRTLGGREVYLLTIGTGKPDEKPAILIVGGVHPPHLAASELAVRLARRIVERAKSDESIRKLLDRVTFYVIPRPAPDACEAFFRKPYFEQTTNERPIDDDGDGQTDEDGPDDLNGDGLITMMRVEDPTGSYILHPDDARVLIKADPKKNERGRYAVYVEGRDNDQDDAQGEDPPGGVAFNRNFTFDYPYFERGSGPHQVSEVETRAVADFAFSHPNIAAVLTFTPEDNLMHPWKPDASAESEKIKTTLLAADAPYFHELAKQYQKTHGGEDAPERPKGHGSFSDWAYFHYGRWSFACRGWWIPKVEVKKTKEDAKKAPNKPDDKKEAAGEKRGTDELNALRWFAREKINGFVDWKPIAHPDYPGRKVEVGGFAPFVRLNPPKGQLKPLVERHWRFVRLLAKRLPSVAIRRTKVEPLGGGVFRVTAVVVNEGRLPTMSQMGRISGQLQPLQIELTLPKGVSLVAGHARVGLPPLAGDGGRAEQTWMVLAPKGKPVALRLRAWSPSVGEHLKTVNLPKAKTP